MKEQKIDVGVLWSWIDEQATEIELSKDEMKGAQLVELWYGARREQLRRLMEAIDEISYEEE